MSDISLEVLIRIVHDYYPVGFPPETDTYTHEPPPYQRTPEFQRWQDAWTKAIQDEPWRVLLSGFRPQFPSVQFGSYTPAYMSAGYVCMLYLRGPRTDGLEGYRLIHVAAAVSLLAPLYFVYGTVQLVTPIPPGERVPWKRFQQHERLGPAELFLQPTEEMRPYAAAFALHVEHTFGYRSFPLELADVPVPDIRVPYLNLEQPTLMNALFLQDLASLP